MLEVLFVLATDHSKMTDPVDALNSLILLSDATNRWLLDQKRPVLMVAVTGMCTSNRPSLVSQTRTDSRVAVAIRSPCGEYLAAASVTLPLWSSVCTLLRVAGSQMEVGLLSDAETSRVESVENPGISYSVSIPDTRF